MLYSRDEFADSVGACFVLVFLGSFVGGTKFAIIIPTVWFAFGISTRYFSKRYERTLPRKQAVREALEELDNELMSNPD